MANTFPGFTRIFSDKETVLRPLFVAVTGGIASGKTTVTDQLSKLGATVIDADLVSRELVVAGSVALAKIVERFGATVLDAQGNLNRQILREIIFNDPNAKAALESILHPLIGERMHELAQQCATAVCVLAIPLLVESKNFAWTHRVVAIDVRLDTQIARLKKRDSISESAALAIIATQSSREQRLAIADFVLDNNGNQAALITQVNALYCDLLNIAKQLES